MLIMMTNVFVSSASPMKPIANLAVMRTLTVYTVTGKMRRQSLAEIKH